MYNQLDDSNSEYNIELYSFYATFKNEDNLREVMKNMTQEQTDYYFPTFDHYLDAINFSNGEYIGSTYIPDMFENYNPANIEKLTQDLLAKVSAR